MLLIAPFILSSCAPTHPLLLAEALLQHPSAESRIILENAVGKLLNSQPIKLANNVFVDKSTIIIQSSQPKDSQGNLLDGREIRQADTVSLLIENAKCYIKHDQSGHIKLVENIRCQAKQN